MMEQYYPGFDAHTHLDFPVFDEDRDDVCKRARDVGVGAWVVAGADPRHWERIETISKTTGGTPLYGIHPWWTEQVDPHTLEDCLARLANRLGAHGMGEIGLDYARAKTQPQRRHQQRLFRAQLRLARERNLPVAIHCVRAFPETLSLLKRDGLPEAGGMIHGWTGAAHFVEPATELGLHISIGPLVTHSQATHVRRAAQITPLERLCLETACPDQPLRPGGRGEPSDLVSIAQVVAQLRGLTDWRTLMSHTGCNAATLWRVPVTPQSIETTYSEDPLAHG